MPKETILTLKLEAELHDEFMSEAAAEDRPATQVVRELMRAYVAERHEAREYRAFLERKVERARADIQAGRTFSNEEVEAEFSAWRAELMKQTTS